MMLTVVGEEYRRTFFVFSEGPRIKSKMVAFTK